MKAISKFLEKIGRSVGKVVGFLYQAGRESVEQVMVNVIPFMAFISLVIGIIVATGIGDLIAKWLSPLASKPSWFGNPFFDRWVPRSLTIARTRRSDCTNYWNTLGC